MKNKNWKNEAEANWEVFPPEIQRNRSFKKELVPADVKKSTELVNENNIFVGRKDR